VCPNQLAVNHGFPLPSNWPLNQNFIEVYWAATGSGTPADLIAAFLRSPGHVGVMFTWPNYEVGAGQYDACGNGASTTCNYLFMHLAPRSPIKLFVTGVVYDDANANGRLDIGEGLPGITVDGGPAGSVTTNGGGGFSLPITAGKYTLTASGPGFATATASFTATSYNVGVDFIAGAPDGAVRAYETCEGLAPTILGTAGDDVITGTPGNDVIHGLDGNDRIDGGGGNDVICGGVGRDEIYGGSGDDLLSGGRGRDRLVGGADTDRLLGGSGVDKLFGSAGVDTLLGGSDADRLDGGDANDTLTGGSGTDTGDGGPGVNACASIESAVNCEP
jgi:Ca2+-binding RTX toxin-like protein